MCEHLENNASSRSASSPPPKRVATRDARDSRGEGTAIDWSVMLHGLVTGDPAARKHVSGIVVRYLHRYGALGEAWSADIAQDVMESLVRSGREGALRDPSALLAYIGTITQRTVLDWADRQGREERKRTALRGHAEAIAGALHPPAPLDRIWVERALAKLPPQAARVLSEIYVAGRSYDETARVLGLTPRQVRRLRTRGLALLRDALGTER